MFVEGQSGVTSAEDVAPGACSRAEAGESGDEEGPSPRADRSAWLEREILPHEPSVRQWLARKVGCPVTVDDMIQDIFVRLSQTASVGHIESPRHYLWSTAFSVFRDRARRAVAAPATSGDSEELVELPCDAPSPFRQVSAKRDVELVLEAMQRLPARSRQVLVLRRLEGLSLEETAQRLKISVSAVEKHQRRAHAFLKQQLARSG